MRVLALPGRSACREKSRNGLCSAAAPVSLRVRQRQRMKQSV